MKNPKNIAITGASSGLGAALARHYAASGITLHLQGRSAERLEQVAETCRARGAAVLTVLADVTDASAIHRWLTETDRKSPIDLVIANAGISAGTGIHGETGAQVRSIFATNIDGVIHTLDPVIPFMIGRKRGQLAIISSLAGLRGLPSCPAYSASKACVRVYGEGLRGWLSAHGVEVSVVCPGYIRTPMTAVNNYPMPFMMSAENAAALIANGLAKNKSRIAFPRLLYWPLWWLTCLPTALTDAFFSGLPAKPSVEEMS